jgi:hypothetical protein
MNDFPYDFFIATQNNCHAKHLTSAGAIRYYPEEILL